MGIAEMWPFDQSPETAAITTRQVIEEGLPVLVVVHYEDDHGWTFTCGTTAESDDGRVVSMREVLVRDPSLRAVADLPPGWCARRESVSGEWMRSVLDDPPELNDRETPE